MFNPLWVYPFVCVRRWSSFIFCMHLYNYPNTVYWLDFLYLIVCSCLLCQILVDHKAMGLFVGCLSCSIDLYVYFYVLHLSICLFICTVFWLQWPCSIVRYRVVWYLQRCSFSTLLLLLVFFCASMYIFGICVLVLWSMPLVFW